MSFGVTFKDGYVTLETLSRAEKFNFWQSLATVHFWVLHPCGLAFLNRVLDFWSKLTIISSLAEERVIEGTEERGRSKRCTKRMIDLVWGSKKRTGAALTSHVFQILDNQLLGRLFHPPTLSPTHLFFVKTKAKPGHWKGSQLQKLAKVKSTFGGVSDSYDFKGNALLSDVCWEANSLSFA